MSTERLSHLPEANSKSLQEPESESKCQTRSPEADAALSPVAPVPPVNGLTWSLHHGAHEDVLAQHLALNGAQPRAEVLAVADICTAMMMSDQVGTPSCWSGRSPASGRRGEGRAGLAQDSPPAPTGLLSAHPLLSRRPRSPRTASRWSSRSGR